MLLILPSLLIFKAMLAQDKLAEAGILLFFSSLGRADLRFIHVRDVLAVQRTAVSAWPAGEIQTSIEQCA